MTPNAHRDQFGAHGGHRGILNPFPLNPVFLNRASLSHVSLERVSLNLASLDPVFFVNCSLILFPSQPASLNLISHKSATLSLALDAAPQGREGNK